MSNPILICDLGGTNCRLGLVRNGALDTGSIASLVNAHAAGFIEVVQTYLQGHNIRLGGIVVALAAPINGDKISLTNLDWMVDKAELKTVFNVEEVLFLNDFKALGYALGDSKKLNSTWISKGSTVESETKLILGAGTGFNCAAFLPENAVTTCEAGHTCFAPVTQFDFRMYDRMTQKHGRCSTERLLSGSGFLEIYSFISGRDINKSFGHDILKAGVTGHDIDAKRACTEFARMLGQTAGDLALLFWARSGVWVSGGPAIGLKQMLTSPDGPFITAFRQKGRMTKEMGSVPVSVMNDDFAALIGCAHFFKLMSTKS